MTGARPLGVHGLALARTMELELPVRAGRDDDGVAFGEPALEHREGERILNQLLDRPLERTRPEGWIVALLGEHALRFRRHLERDLAVGEQAFEALELQVDDALDLLGPKGTEENRVVDAVEELGLEGAP